MENPRQIPAFRYSARYGLLPPCFARATIVPDPSDGKPILLAAGTASIRGEQTVYVGDIRQQLDETLVNLRKLLETAQPLAEGGGSLAAFSDVRIYYVRGQDAPVIIKVVDEIFGAEVRLELILRRPVPLRFACRD